MLGAGGAVVSVESAGLGARAANAVVAYARYAVRAVWPSELSVLHGPRASSALEVGVSALFLAALAVWAWRRRSDRPWRFVGLAWFLGTNGRGDVLLFGTGGIAIGAMLAEVHHVRHRRGPRSAGRGAHRDPSRPGSSRWARP